MKYRDFCNEGSRFRGRQFYTKKIGPLTQRPEREGISAVNYARYQNGYTMGKFETIFQKGTRTHFLHGRTHRILRVCLSLTWTTKMNSSRSPLQWMNYGKPAVWKLRLQS